MKIEFKAFAYNAGLSQDSNAFSAKLYIDGKPAARVLDSGYGGGLEIHWQDEGLEKRFKDFLDTLEPTDLGVEGCSPLKWDEDLYLGTLAEVYIKRQYFQRICRRSWAFETAECTAPSFLTVPRSSCSKEKLRMLHPDITVLWNDWIEQTPRVEAVTRKEAGTGIALMPSLRS